MKLKPSKAVPQARPQPPGLHADIEAALDILLNTCNKHRLAVAGFIYGTTAPLTLYNFGNTQKAAEIETYEKLVKLCDTRRMLGAIVKLKPRKPN